MSKHHKSVYVRQVELNKGMFEVMAEMAITDFEYTLAAIHYLNASKEAKTQHDTIRLFNLSQEALRKSYQIEALGME